MAGLSSSPIDDALPALRARLSETPNVVLSAPPGAGKTTRVPLALLSEAWTNGGTILMLEPRRAAARAAADRMASTLGETVGETVGYRIRDDAKVSRATRVEVITEGILARRLQGDPELSGVAAVLFDEFHERSIHADLGLALCLEAQTALRPEMRLLVMSATLEAGSVAALLGGDGDPAPVVVSEGRAFPVETRWLARPSGGARGGAGRAPGPRFEDQVADLTRRALDEETGDALVFLPGAGEIDRVASRLGPEQTLGAKIVPLFGDLPLERQRAALRPDPGGARRVVLATALAETSLTIDGVRIVVDAGRARRARFDPGSGMSRLVTERVSKASADQRRGRAGRTAPGVCYRMWAKAEEGALRAVDPPEILEADLAPIALELAVWGARPADLPFLDPPPEQAHAQAVALLQALGALDAAGRATDHGRALAKIPLHPRLAHLALRAGGSREALRLAALLEARDPLRGTGADLAERMAALDAPGARPAAKAALERIRDAAKRLERRLPRPSAGGAARGAGPRPSPGALLALAYPDRVAQRRPGEAPRFLLANGAGAKLDPADALANRPFLAAADLDGDPREAAIRLAADLSLGEIETLFEDRIVWEEDCVWSKRDGAVRARRRRRLGALTLAEERWRDAPAEAVVAAMLEGVAQLGLDALPWTDAARRLQARAARGRMADPTLPDLSDAALATSLAAWLGPHLSSVRSKAELGRLDLASILAAQLDWDAKTRLDALAPAAFVTPLGGRAPIDYASDPPRAAIRLQELFGVTEHPSVAGQALLLDLLSPANRPIQTTADLPGFWAGSYAEVRKEMRAKYPRHAWPEDPTAAEPTRRAKPRKG